MTYLMTRVDNQNSYLRSDLTESDKFVCDCLEFASKNRVPAGAYKIIVKQLSPFSRALLELLDENDKHVKFLNFETAQYYRGVYIRYNNGSIHTCLLVKGIQAQMVESMNNLIASAIIKDDQRGIPSSFTIVEPSNLDDTIQDIEYVTEY